MKKGSFHWEKSIQPWYWGPKTGSPVLDSQVFSFDINTEHKTYHGVGAVLSFPYCYFRIQYTEITHTLCMSNWTWVRQTVGMCEGFLTRIFCVGRCTNLRGGVWVLREDWCSPGLANVQVQREIKCWFPVRILFSIGPFPKGGFGFLFLWNNILWALWIIKVCFHQMIYRSSF
jgi:hypothetical protein